MQTTMDSPAVRGVLVALIGILLMFAAPAVAAAKDKSEGARAESGLIAVGAGYDKPHGSTQVRALQRRLHRAGERPGPVDGRFGPLTEAAVERFQARQGLSVDGVVGEATSGRLARFAAVSAARPSARTQSSSKPTQRPRPDFDAGPTPIAQGGPARVKNPKPRATEDHPGSGLPGWLTLAVLGVVVLLAGAAALPLARRPKQREQDEEVDDTPPFQVRIHGPNGQGVMTAAELLSVAALVEGRHALAFPSLRPGRGGPRVVAFCRIGGRPIRPHQPIGQPDGLIIHDPALIQPNELFDGLGPAGYLLINSTRSIAELGLDDLVATLREERRLTIPATEIAREHLGLPIPDAALVGGFAALSGIVSCRRWRARSASDSPDPRATATSPRPWRRSSTWSERCGDSPRGARIARWPWNERMEGTERRG
jgi:pyruvate ferredoxin oxidoreductase gamma subunit